MGMAESAILLGLHTIRMSLLVLGQVVIAPFALRAGKCDLGTHRFSPPVDCIKKTPNSCQLVNYSIIIFTRQRLFQKDFRTISGLLPVVKSEIPYLVLSFFGPLYIEKTRSPFSRKRPICTVFRLFFCEFFTLKKT